MKLFRKLFKEEEPRTIEDILGSKKDMSELSEKIEQLEIDADNKCHKIIKLDKQIQQQNEFICQQANYIKELEAKVLRLV